MCVFEAKGNLSDDVLTVTQSKSSGTKLRVILTLYKVKKAGYFLRIPYPDSCVEIVMPSVMVLGS